jgi:hypothetical protein
MYLTCTLNPDNFDARNAGLVTQHRERGITRRVGPARTDTHLGTNRGIPNIRHRQGPFKQSLMVGFCGENGCRSLLQFLDAGVD